MPDTKAGRDKKGHDEEQQQRVDELEAELEYDAAADTRRADRGRGGCKRTRQRRMI